MELWAVPLVAVAITALLGLVGTLIASRRAERGVESQVAVQGLVALVSEMRLGWDGCREELRRCHELAAAQNRELQADLGAMTRKAEQHGEP